MDEKSHWVPEAIGMVIIASLFGGLVIAIYPSWPVFWSWIGSLKFSMNWTWSSFFTAIAGLAAAVSAFFSWKALAHTRLAKQDDELLIHCILTLERSYLALMSEGFNGSPIKNRLNWLTSARLIVDYIDTKKQIKSAEIIRRCEGHEEHWRNMFRKALEPISLQFGYFSDGLTDPEQVYKISAIIIHGFAEWPKGRMDNLDNYSGVDDAIENFGLSQKWASLIQYLGRL